MGDLLTPAQATELQGTPSVAALESDFPPPHPVPVSPSASPQRLLNQITPVTQLANLSETEQAAQEAKQAAQDLATLNARVNQLQGRTSQLAAQQFAPTTRLVGWGIVVLSDAYGGQAGERTQPALQYRSSVSLLTSFTGKDQLLMVLRTGNVPTSPLGFALPSTVAPPGIPIPSAEGTPAYRFSAALNNQFVLTTLEYQFPVGQRLRFFVATNSELFNQFTNTLNPYFDDNDGGRGAISTFGQRNPIYRFGGGPGAGMTLKLTNQLTLTAGYLTPFILGGGDPQRGFINSGYSALGQLTWKPTSTFAISTTYLHAYHQPGRFGFNNTGLYLTGTAVANTLAGQVSIADALGLNPNGAKVAANAYAVQFSYQPHPHLVLNGWLGYIHAQMLGASMTRQGDGQLLTYALNIGFPDLGGQGNFLGFVVGAEPYLTSFTGGNPQPFRVDIPWHLEAFYRWQVRSQISITPALIWLTAPNQDNRNPDTVIALIRTSFNF